MFSHHHNSNGHGCNDDGGIFLSYLLARSGKRPPSVQAFVLFVAFVTALGTLLCYIVIHAICPIQSGSEIAARMGYDPQANQVQTQHAQSSSNSR